MTYEEFEDRRGASTTDNRRAVWDAGFEEGRRTGMKQGNRWCDKHEEAWAGVYACESCVASLEAAIILATTAVPSMVIDANDPIGMMQNLVNHVAKLEAELAKMTDAEHRLSDSYVRIRNILGAFDTPTAPTAEQVWEHTEAKAGQLVNELAECRRKINDSIGTLFRIECDLGNALYGTSEDGLPLWGEHTAETLAEEAARKLGQNPPEKRSPDPPLKPTEKLSASSST